MEDASTEVHRLSRCLSQGSFPSSESTEAEGDMGEQDNVKKVAVTKYWTNQHFDRMMALKETSVEYQSLEFIFKGLEYL